MNKKYLYLLLPLALVLVAATIVTPGKRITEYPRASTLSDTDVLVAGRTNAAVPTNVGITSLNYLIQATNGLATTNYVNTAGTTVSNGVVTFTTNLVTVTSNAIVGSASPVLWTNSGGIVMLTTNGPVSIASTGLLGGLVVTQDMRILGHNVASNSLWVATNSTTGEGEWRTFTAVGIAGIAEILWTNVSGTLRPVTNVFNFRGGGSNNTIVSPAGFNVIGGGADNDIFANTTHATIAGGFDNSVLSNTAYATLVGGQQNIAASNAVFVGGGAGNTARGNHSVIVGGDNNTTVNDNGVIVGGTLNSARGRHSVISGGSNNVMFGESGVHNVIAGGQGNQMGIGATFHTAHSVISGGLLNTIQNGCFYSVIGGGRANTITGDGGTNSAILGGANNTVGASLPKKFAAILGGERNLADGDYSFAIGGASNNAAAARSGAIGMNVTNNTAGSVTVGELISYNTPAVIAGAGSGSTNYLLAVTSPKMLLGSSNVHIYGVSGTIAGKTHNWSVNITNLSGDTWGIGFSSGTNRWKFQSYMYGTSAPVVLTNNTLLRLNGASEGTNTLVTYEYFSPAL